MATKALTLDQILNEMRQWSEAQRKKLIREIEALPKPAQTLAAARRLRSQYRMGKQQRRRMSELLAQRNARPLTVEEQLELDRLVELFEEKTLALAQALIRSQSRSKASSS